MKYMLDTNVCIDYMKGNSERIKERITSAGDDALCISAITLSELLFGVENSVNRDKNRTALLWFLVKVDVVSFDDKAAETYGKVRKELTKNGNLIGSMDMLIAAHSRSLGLTLVTHNTREFKRVTGLAVEDWY